ncbi:dihydrokaempferol 4-reductase [Aureococcus anophagefferens]|nr:dihydrokaempferol 4-reductase [Aureococcus anophagefferens]
MDLPVCLVTGVSGFVAGHVALALLETKRFRVRGTVRDPNNAAAVAHLAAHATLKDVELVEADLLSDAGWEAALEGCAYCCHCASPFPIGEVEAGSLVAPAVEGTERVLRFAKQAGVQRVVVTSSVVAISSGRDPKDTAPRTFSEADFSNADLCEEYPRARRSRRKRPGR